MCEIVAFCAFTHQRVPATRGTATEQTEKHERTKPAADAPKKVFEDPMERIVSKIRAGLKKEGWAKQNLIRDRHAVTTQSCRRVHA